MKSSNFLRELIFTEKKVNFSHLDKMGKGLAGVLDQKLKKFTSIVIENQANDQVIKQIVNIVTLIQKEAFEVGKKSAATEMKVSIPKTNKKIIDIMKEQNTKVIKKMISDINKKLKEKGFSEGEQFSNEGIVSKFFNGLKSLYVYGSINMGRETIYEQNKELIYAFQYSAILDGKTTDLCRSLDGMIIKPDDSKRQKFNPPNHWNCRSIWVEILHEEEGKPDFEDKNPEDQKIMKDYKKDNKEIENLTKRIVEKETGIDKDDIFNKYYNNNIIIKDEEIQNQIKEAKQVGLLEEERKAINLYTGHQNSFLLNEYLRSKKKGNKELDLFSEILTNSLEKLDNFEGDTYRVMNFKSESKALQFIKELSNKQMYYTEGFVSTTTNKDHTQQFLKIFENNFIFKIKSNNGKNLHKLESYKESEVLFNKGTNFKVNSIKKLNSKDIDGFYKNNQLNDLKELTDEGSIHNYLIELEDLNNLQFNENTLISLINELEKEFDLYYQEFILKTYK